MAPRDAAPPATAGEAIPGRSLPVAGLVQAAPRPGAARVWFQAIRPWSFAASVVPVTVGAACAILVGQFSLPAFLLCLLGGVTLQAATNLVNDYYDWRQGADHSGSLGPSRVIQQGWLSPRAVLLGGVGLFVLAGLCGFVLTAMAGWSILLLGLIGVPLAYGYSAPPLKLAYRGLGELNVFFLMGPVMVLGGVLVHGAAGAGVGLAASIPVGFLVASILHANNIRDLDDDRQLGKRTIATLVGMRWAKRE
ncbi:MAG: 1,4-dihydroxy-2-naphthoate octaprenyltransferase, partial [Chloroflexota bacterium]|nr:1,4-dihydroxy-2-naphthoate octaprenyltransferase [Chloroflexota bacterium]